MGGGGGVRARDQIKDRREGDDAGIIRGGGLGREHPRAVSSLERSAANATAPGGQSVLRPA